MVGYYSFCELSNIDFTVIIVQSANPLHVLCEICSAKTFVIELLRVTALITSQITLINDLTLSDLLSIVL